MSDGGQGRASLGVEVRKSSQKWSAQRSAVRSIAWLGLVREDGFDLISIRIENEGGKIAGTMLGMKTHTSVVPSAVC
jgi:hypothetical protein